MRSADLPESAGDSPYAEPKGTPNLLVALGLATLAHVLLLVALTAPPGFRRGADAPASRVELRSGIRAQIISEPAPAVAEHVNPVPMKLEASGVGVVIEQKVPVQKKPEEPVQQLTGEPQPDHQEPQQPRQQQQGCLGPEEMARLQQARDSQEDPQNSAPAVEVGVPCVEG